MKTQPNTDFSQFRDYLIKVLPQLLREEPALATTIEGIVAQQFPRRDDFARLLEEVKSQRQEMNLRFELRSQEFQEHRMETEQRLNLLRQEWREEREQFFNQLRQEWRKDIENFGQQLRQEWRKDMEDFGQLLRQEWHKDLVDFGQQLRQEWRKDMEDFGQQLRQEWRKDIEDFGQQLRQEWRKDMEDFGQQLRQEWRNDLGELRQEMEGRFEQVDKRFEQIDKRFEQVDKRFEQVDQRFEQVDKRFEQVDKRFEQVDEKLTGLRQDVTQLKRDVLKLQSGQEGIIKRLDGQEAWLKVAIGNLRNEKGQSLEDMFAVGLRYGLKDEDITPETIQLRQPLIDEDGLVFKKGYVTEVDVVAQNGKLIVFEVKATAKPSEVDLFTWKVQLVTAQHPTLQVRGVFICLGALPEVKQRCLENGLELLS